MGLGLHLGLGLSSGGGVAIDPDAQEVIDAMVPTPNGARQSAINGLVVALKAAGVWNDVDELEVHAAHAEQAALLNWKNPGSVTPPLNNGCAFQIDRGFTGNGVDGRIQTRFNPSVNGVQYLQDDASLWCWNRTSSLSTVADIGSVEAPGAGISVLDGNGDTRFALNDDVFSVQATGSSLGFFGTSRSDANTKKVWRNGIQVGTGTASVATGLPILEQWICGGNPTSFSARQIAAAAWGASLTGKELAFYNAMLTYMTAVGAV